VAILLAFSDCRKALTFHRAQPIILQPAFNAATAVGPAAAGVTYAAFGPAWCFTLNGLSFIAVIVALLMMRIRPQAEPARRASAAGDLMEGLRYVAAHPIIRALIGLVGVLSLFGVSLFTLLPAWAVEVLRGDAATLGWLQSARGAAAQYIGEPQTVVVSALISLGAAVLA
jgi:hypothetical protein